MNELKNDVGYIFVKDMNKEEYEKLKERILKLKYDDDYEIEPKIIKIDFIGDCISNEKLLDSNLYIYHPNSS